MKAALQTLAIGVVAVASVAPTASAQTMEGHKIVSAQEIEWGPAPPSIPPGAQAAVLYGDPGKEGLFSLRLKLPKDYAIPPHTHPKPEVVTVISGTFRLGMGEKADKSKGQALPAGSFFAMQTVSRSPAAGMTTCGPGSGTSCPGSGPSRSAPTGSGTPR